MSNMVNMANSEHGEQEVHEQRSRRFVMMLTESEHDALQNYRFSRQIGSKSKAVRALMMKGLEAEKMATTGSEFGDLTPSKPENNSNQEKADVGSDI